MSFSDPVLYPCPKCGKSRGEADGTCPHCGWSPHVMHIPATPKFEPMSKAAATLVGIVTLLPITYAILFILESILLIAGTDRLSSQSFAILAILHVSVILLSWVLLGFYIWHLFKTELVPNDMKALWAVVLFLGNMLTMPVYWYLYIWKPAESGY